ncbi:hypothetical protein A2U01_0060112, partial [Trifolium medium]|nr:hypothetical protein [Trifolium medium]
MGNLVLAVLLQDMAHFLEVTHRLVLLHPEFCFSDDSKAVTSTFMILITGIPAIGIQILFLGHVVKPDQCRFCVATRKD